MKPRIVLAGGSGFVGQLLSPFLVSKNCEVIVLTRAEPDHGGAVRNVHWNGKTVADWVEFVNGAYAMVNLTGRSINCRHTPENRREIIDSRVDSVRVLGQAIGRCAQPPQVFLQIAGVGIYGDKGERICDETTAPGDDFMTEVCQKWEAAFDSVDAPKTRKVQLTLFEAPGVNGVNGVAGAGLTTALIPEPERRTVVATFSSAVRSGSRFSLWKTSATSRLR